jgi:hypothetical protein
LVATVTTRLAIDEPHSARARRQDYGGERLPEPIITGQADSGSGAEMARRFFQATPRSRSLRSAGQSVTSHRYRGRRAIPTNVTVLFRRTTDPNNSYQPKDKPNVDKPGDKQ